MHAISEFSVTLLSGLNDGDGKELIGLIGGKWRCRPARSTHLGTFASTAASPDLIASGAITRSATGAATGFAVVWPDGATGTFTGTESTTAPGAIDAYTVTHVVGGTTTTYTQPALTRDATGAVTNRPAMTVS